MRHERKEGEEEEVEAAIAPLLSSPLVGAATEERFLLFSV